MKLRAKLATLVASSAIALAFITPSVTAVSAASGFDTTPPVATKTGTGDITSDWSAWSPEQITQFLNSASTLQPAVGENANVALPKKNLSASEIDALVNELAVKYPTLSKEYLRNGVYKQLNGDYSIAPDNFSNGVSLRAWAGITVSQMGAAIDTAIAIALGVSTGGLGAAIGHVGKHAAESVVRNVVVKSLGSKALAAGIDFAVALSSPGGDIAKWWDQHDAYPNNGIINF